MGSTKKKHEKMSENGQHVSMKTPSIFNNAEAFEEESPKTPDIHMSNTSDEDAEPSSSADDNINSVRAKRKRNGDGREARKDENADRSPPAKKTPSSSKGATTPADSVRFAKASLANTDLLSTPNKAGPGSARTPPPPPSKTSGKKAVGAEAAVRKTTCRRCAERGVTCKPHVREPEKYRCNKCMGDKMKKVDCVMIDAAEAAAITSGASADTTQSDDGGREVTPTPTGAARGKKGEATPSPIQTPTPAVKSSRLGPPPTPDFTPGEKASHDPPAATTPTPDLTASSSTSDSGNQPSMTSSESVQTYYDKYSQSTDHEYRMMSQLLWATHADLRNKVQQVQQAERKYNDLRRGQRDLAKALEEFMGVPKLRDILEKAVKDVEQEQVVEEERSV